MIIISGRDVLTNKINPLWTVINVIIVIINTVNILWVGAIGPVRLNVQVYVLCAYPSVICVNDNENENEKWWKLLLLLV